jgi:hypothetical protein
MNLHTTEILTRDRFTAAAIFAFILLVFLFSRVHQVTDSRYSMLVSQSLVSRGSFTLDAYKLPRYPAEWAGFYFRNGPIYQIEVADGHLYHLLPPGTPVLSAPYVALLNIFGISPASADGTYNENWEVRIEASLAALLMALLAAVFFSTARLVLSATWSIIIALGGALGTQVYSTASRALWSETWGILLLGIVVYFLLRHETGKRKFSPILLATLLSWSYFVRPTFAIHIAAITVYVLIFYRRLFFKYALTGAAWFGGFVFYSWFHFHRILPAYYAAGRLQFQTFWTALAGNLVSPARGVLIYVPVLLFVGYLLVRYWNYAIHQRLVWLSLSIIAGQLIAVSGFSHWWGGHSFGARMTTGLVPWFVIVAILSVFAMQNWRREGNQEQNLSRLAPRVALTAGSVLLLLSIVINTLGATSHATWLWNLRPQEIDRHPERLWDWRQPQFLAKYLPYPPPSEVPSIANTRVDFNSPGGEKFLWYGWIRDETGRLWSDNSAAIVFSVPATANYVLRMNIRPFIVPGKLDQQRIRLVLNDRLLSSLTLTDPEFQTYTVIVPADFLREKNTLKLEMPDAQSPQKMGTGDDPRARAISVEWIEFAQTNP